jgi:hypothetical protein
MCIHQVTASKNMGKFIADKYNKDEGTQNHFANVQGSAR